MSAPEKDPTAPHTRRLAGLLLLAVFVAGGLSGAGLEHLRLTRFPGFPGHPPHMPPMMQELDLSPQQAQQIEAIFQRHRPQLDAITQEVFPRMREVMKATDAEINTVLTPAQREKAEKMRARFGLEPPPGGPAGHAPPLPPPFLPDLLHAPGGPPQPPMPPASQPAAPRSESAHSYSADA